MTKIEVILGLILAVSFSISYIPQILQILVTKSSKDVSIYMLFLNLTGCVCGVIYTTIKIGYNNWLAVNYLLSTILVIILVIISMKFSGNK